MRDALAAAALLIAGAAAAETLATVADVHDGDTLTLASGERVRLAEIDAPELGQPYGAEARAALSARVLGRTVAVEPEKRRSFGRRVAVLRVDGASVNLALVAEGVAWCDTRHLLPQSECPAAEADARAARRGLWALPDPRAPWLWRAAR